MTKKAEEHFPSCATKRGLGRKKIGRHTLSYVLTLTQVLSQEAKSKGLAAWPRAQAIAVWHVKVELLWSSRS